MRKPPLDPSLFTFSPTAGTVTFAAGATRPTHQGQIVSIVNTSNETYLYLPAQTGRGGTYDATTGVLTLEINTTTMSSNHALQIVVDDSEIGATSALQAAGNNLLTGINDKLPALNDGAMPMAPNVTRGAGNVDANTQRVSLAADGPAVTALAALDTDIGSPSDAPATSDSGTAAIIPLLKRIAERFTSILLKAPAFATAGAPSADVLSVQGVSGGQALPVTAPPVAVALSSYSFTGAIAINTELITLDCSQFRGLSVQCTSMGTAGAVILEWSNNNVIWQSGFATSSAGASSASITTTVIVTTPVYARYFRIRLSVAATAGTTALSVHQFDTSFQNWLATQPVSLAAGNLSPPAIVADVTSAALTATTTTAAITPASGIGYSVCVPVTAVSGTSPTLDITVEESDNTGTDWFKVYDFPRITATGVYRTPIMRLSGNRLRYAQIVSPGASFTRSINRLQCSTNNKAVRQLIDRTIVLTTLNSTTPSVDTRDAGAQAQLLINVGAIATTAPAVQLEGSDDNGVSWYNIGAPLTAVANSTVLCTVTDINSSALRGRVSTAGVGVTMGYVMIKAQD